MTKALVTLGTVGSTFGAAAPSEALREPSLGAPDPHSDLCALHQQPGALNLIVSLTWVQMHF